MGVDRSTRRRKTTVVENLGSGPWQDGAARTTRKMKVGGPLRIRINSRSRNWRTGRLAAARKLAHGKRVTSATTCEEIVSEGKIRRRRMSHAKAIKRMNDSGREKQ